MAHNESGYLSRLLYPSEGFTGELRKFETRERLSSMLRGDVPPKHIQAARKRMAIADLLARSTEKTKRKAFFSFHYDDVMRVNNVRNAFKIYNPESLLVKTFYDSSLWESKKLEGEESLRALIRDGVKHTSVVCVLIGSETWKREWVRYEIARSIVDGKGLLAVDLNSINHHLTKLPSQQGLNPLSYMGVGKQYGQYKLFELAWRYLDTGPEWGWWPYSKYSLPIDLPKYCSSPGEGYVVSLDRVTARFDFVSDTGSKNIGNWLDSAARAAGR